MLSDVPTAHGYAEALAGVSVVGGPFARLEMGYRPLSQFGLFGFGEWTPGNPMAGVGARWTF